MTGDERFQDNENLPKRLAFIFLVPIISVFFLSLFWRCLPVVAEEKHVALQFLFLCGKRSRRLSSQFAGVWELHRSSQLKNASDEDCPLMEAFSLNQADLTWNCSDVGRLRGWEVGCRGGLIWFQTITDVLVLWDRFLVFRAADCERLLISCWCKTGGWFI